MSKSDAGSLFVVATPIGNLGDISARAAKTLADVDLILAEDSRHSKKLLQYLCVSTPVKALHEHNEDQQSQAVVDRLSNGENIALISDAGTPLISDPGYRLVAAARDAGIKVATIPGPSAVIAALSVSGLATDRFQFEGFLPAKTAARRRRLGELAELPHSLVLFEAPHRIKECVRDICDSLGADRRICIARELTKMHEQSHTATAKELVDWLQEDANRCRGEFVLVVDSADIDESTDALDVRRLLFLLADELPPKKAAAITAEITGTKPNALYKMLMAERNKT